MSEEISLLCIDPVTKFWYFRAGERARYFLDFKYNNYISAGSDYVNLKKIHDELEAKTAKGKVTEKRVQHIYENIFTQVHEKITRESAAFQKIDTLDISDDKKVEERQKLIKDAKNDGRARARNAFLLEQKMSVGDVVIVPSYGSRTLLIGIVFSQVTSDDMPYYELFEDEKKEKRKDYDRSKYTFKRQVYWLREVDYREFPKGLQGIKLQHRAINELVDNLEGLQLLLANQFVYKNKVHARIDVTTEKAVLSNDLFDLQKAIKDLNVNNVQIEQKTQISSPGYIELIAHLVDWQHFLIVSMTLIGGQVVKNSEIKLEDIAKLIPLTNTRKIFKENQAAELNEAKIRKLESEKKLKEIEDVQNSNQAGGEIDVPDNVTSEVENVRNLLEIEERNIITLPAYTQDENLKKGKK